jgi:hypothetical protein
MIYLLAAALSIASFGKIFPDQPTISFPNTSPSPASGRIAAILFVPE